jgi:hypothetical protein
MSVVAVSDVGTSPDSAPEDRIRGIADILARGLIRLHERSALPCVPAPEKSQTPVEKGLEEAS